MFTKTNEKIRTKEKYKIQNQIKNIFANLIWIIKRNKRELEWVKRELEDIGAGLEDAWILI